MKNYIKYIVFFVVFVFSCTQKNKTDKLAQNIPKYIEAKGYKVPKDSISEANIVIATKFRVQNIGKTKIIYTNTNEIIAGKPEIITINNPRIIKLGQDSFLMPTVVKSTCKQILAGNPEIVEVKDAYIKDKNPGNFSSFGKLQGLNHQIIKCLLEDKTGNLWIGTDGGGISKYDGKYFTHYTEKQGLSNNKIRCLIQDKHGNIWIGTGGGGVSKFDGKYFTIYSEKEGLNKIVRSIFEDTQGNLWFGTNGGGLIKYDGKYFIKYTKNNGLNSNSVWSVFQDKNKNIWFGTDAGVSKFDGKTFIHYTKKNGLTGNSVWAIYQDKNEKIWFGTTGGISKFDGKTFTNYTKKEGLNSETVTSIIQDENGIYWFGTEEGGICKFDGKKFTDFKESDGLINSNISAVMQDKRKNLWIATSGGLAKYNGNIFTHFTVQEGFINNITRSIFCDKKRTLWFGSDGNGVASYNINDSLEQSKYLTQYNIETGLLSNSILSIIQDKNNNIWFGTYGGGVSIFDGNKFKHITTKEGLSSNNVYGILEDKNGNYWFATFDGGASKFDGTKFTHYNIKNGLTNNRVWSIVEDNVGNIWFATDNGITKFDGKFFTQFTEKQGIRCKEINFAFIDKIGNIWFGTNCSGVIKYDGSRIEAIEKNKTISPNDIDLIKINGKYIKTFTYFSEKEGLINNKVLSITQDDDENIWFGTNFGLSKLSQKKLIEWELNNNKLNKAQISIFKNYNYEDGFLGIGCNRSSIFHEKKGNLWIGANDRLTRYHKSGDYKDSISPNIQLTQIDLFNEVIDWRIFLQKNDTNIILENGIKINNITFDSLSHWYNIPQNISLNYNNNFLTFKFIGISLKQSKKVKYKFKLEGLDENWSVPTTKNEATYGNLPFGNYIFKVKAANSEGFWSKEYCYNFSIRPPWWKKPIFNFLKWFLLLNFIFGLYILRVTTLKRQKRKLEQIVEIKTSEVKQQKDELLAINEELTQQKEEILVQTEQLQYKNDKLMEMDEFKKGMTSMIVHDLKNPLNLILNVPKNINQEKQLNLMQQSGKQMLNMVLNILDVNKYEETQMKLNLEEKEFTSIAFNSLKQVQFLCEQKNIKIQNEIRYPTFVKVEEETIERVLVNILTNAIKYSPFNGIIILKTNILSDEFVQLEIQDQGEGIPIEKYDLVFQKFGQISAKNSGGVTSTGIGLSFCKMAVEAHGGQIDFQSKPGEGTNFRFTLQCCNGTKSDVNSIEQEIKKEDIRFSDDEIKRLTPIIEKLKFYTIYETGDIESILNEIKQDKSENIKKWIEMIEGIFLTLNQSKYTELLKLNNIL